MLDYLLFFEIFFFYNLLYEITKKMNKKKYITVELVEKIDAFFFFTAL